MLVRPAPGVDCRHVEIALADDYACAAAGVPRGAVSGDAAAETDLHVRPAYRDDGYRQGRSGDSARSPRGLSAASAARSRGRQRGPDSHHCRRWHGGAGRAGFRAGALAAGGCRQRAAVAVRGQAARDADRRRVLLTLRDALAGAAGTGAAHHAGVPGKDAWFGARGRHGESARPRRVRTPGDGAREAGARRFGIGQAVDVPPDAARPPAPPYSPNGTSTTAVPCSGLPSRSIGRNVRCLTDSKAAGTSFPGPVTGCTNSVSYTHLT